MPPKTNAEKQKDYYARMKARGFVKVCVYIPQKHRKDIHIFAEELREMDAESENESEK